MRRIAETFVLLIFVVSTAYADARLLGEWKSDRVTTVSFVKDHVKWPSDQLEVLSQMFGHLVLAFVDDTVSMRLPDHEVETPEGPETIQGFDEQHPYTVLGSDLNSVAIMVKMPNGVEEGIVLYHFESDDQMWTYVGDMGAFSSIHIREYFRRVK